MLSQTCCEARREVANRCTHSKPASLMGTDQHHWSPVSRCVQWAVCSGQKLAAQTFSLLSQCHVMLC
jgi:hypothetical protein